MPPHRVNTDAVAHARKLIDPEATEENKGRHVFPYGNFTELNRAALIHGKQRAAQNGHDAIEKAFDDLLQRLDEKRDYS